MNNRAQSKGIGGWLGRQVGHVINAMKTSIPHATIVRRTSVEEQAMPGRSNVKLRRTVTDELIVTQQENAPSHPR
jgi:hypothetical protein